MWAAVEAHLGGADGITVHLREDRRHIHDDDVRRLREIVHIKLNLEMAATAEMIGIAVRLKPEMAMLVPEGRHEITTEGGLDVAAQEAKIKDAVTEARRRGHQDQRVHRRRHAAGRGRGARRRKGLRDPHRTLRARVPRQGPRPAKRGGRRRAREDPRGGRGRSVERGMRFNAGHALNYFNVQPVAALPGVRELHIGHAIVSRAVFVGLREAVRQMKALLREAAQ